MPVKTSPTSISLVIDGMRFLTPSAASWSGAQMKIVPSSWMSMSAPNSSVMPRMVSPPLPITSPIWSGLIWIVKMRGAHWRELAARLGDGLGHLAEDEQPRLAACSSASLRISNVTPADLDVHLQGGDALGGAGDLEVHVAEVVLDARDVGEHDVVVALLDEPHGDAGHRRA